MHTAESWSCWYPQRHRRAYRRGLRRAGGNSTGALVRLLAEMDGTPAQEQMSVIQAAQDLLLGGSHGHGRFDPCLAAHVNRALEMFWSLPSIVPD